MRVDDPVAVDIIVAVRRLGDDAARVVEWALRMEGALHQIGDHGPPDGVDPVSWCQDMARWAIRPDQNERPCDGR